MQQPGVQEDDMPGGKRARVLASVVAAVSVILCTSSPLQAATTYTVTDIGDFSNGEPTAINSGGDVVGYKLVAGHWHALLWRGGVLTDLGTFGASDALAFDINDAGVIALVLNTPSGLRNAVWDGQTLTDITSAAGYFKPSLNAGGEMVGAATGPQPFFYSAGVVTTLPSGPCRMTLARDFNTSGTIVGSDCGGAVPVAWLNGAYQQLPAPQGGRAFEAYAVNALGQVAGYATSLVRWLPDGQGGYTVEDLGRLPGAGSCGTLGLTDSGVMTGDCDSTAFVWDSVSGLRDLNTISALPAGAFLESGHDINNAGVIVARGIVDGHFEGYLLTPSAENQAPTASAGPNQTVRPGTLVHLDGSGSSDDNTSTALLGYAWSFDSTPEGSAATLSGANTMTPSFVPDVLGEYSVRLIVTDQSGASSAPAYVVVGQNTPPMADAGLDRLVVVGHPVTLAGSATDAEHDPLLTTWTFTSRPAGSLAAFDDALLLAPSFTPDRPGAYMASLVAADMLGEGAPDDVTVTATTAATYAEIKVQAAADVVVNLPPGAVTNAGNQNTLAQFLSIAAMVIHSGHPSVAIQKLQATITRLDGCANHGGPDTANGPDRDWVTTCSAQGQIYPLLQDALAALTP